MKSPNWYRDEIILALDLYHNLEPKNMDYNNPKVIELSVIFNNLPIHKDSVDEHKLRTLTIVGKKLSNFKAMDCMSPAIRVIKGFYLLRPS